MGLDGVELVMAFEEEFGVTISNGEAEKMVTPGMVIQTSVKTRYFDDLSRKLNAPRIGRPYVGDDTQRRPC